MTSHATYNSSVCRCWRDVARKVRKSRQKHMWVLYQGDVPGADIHEEVGAKLSVSVSSQTT